MINAITFNDTMQQLKDALTYNCQEEKYWNESDHRNADQWITKHQHQRWAIVELIVSLFPEDKEYIEETASEWRFAIMYPEGFKL